MPTTIRDALSEASRALSALPQATPRLEAELLLCDAAGLERARLLAWPDREIGDSQLWHFHDLLRRRLAGEPIAYIRGRRAFWTLELRVTPDTLIPRPETELLVELALALLRDDAPLLVADAGSGSGAVAAAIASERPFWTLIAIDYSLAAAGVARGNLRDYAPGNARVLVGDWLTPIAERSLNAVVANPPYVALADPHLELGDLPWEPRNALVAGYDGLDAIRTLSAQAATRLQPAGLIALEHGLDQGSAVRRVLARCGFGNVATHVDLAGRERVTTGWLTDPAAAPSNEGSL